MDASGRIETATAGMVMVADADFVLSACEVAVTVPVAGVVKDAGAV